MVQYTVHPLTKLSQIRLRVRVSSVAQSEAHRDSKLCMHCGSPKAELEVVGNCGNCVVSQALMLRFFEVLLPTAVSNTF